MQIEYGRKGVSAFLIPFVVPHAGSRACGKYLLD